MPPLTIKRKDTLVKAVRRNATRQLDAAIDELTGPDAAPDVARRELLRLQSLLHLVRRPLGGDVFGREHRAVTRGLKLLAPPPASLNKNLSDLAAIEPALDAAAAIAQLAEADPAGAVPKRRKKIGPDPKQLRLVADLAEMRMRARYWHLPDGGFELLAPGLRQSYQRARNSGVTGSAPAEWAGALARLADHLQAFERAWPSMLRVMRKSLRDLERQAWAQADLVALGPAVQDHPELSARLDGQVAAAQAGSLPLRTQVFVETPAAFAKRLGGIWDAWRA